MGAPRTKTRMVLKHTQGSVFESEPEELGERTTLLILDPDAVDDMDYPDVITVTIEPGDLLN